MYVKNKFTSEMYYSIYKLFGMFNKKTLFVNKACYIHMHDAAHILNT